MRLLSLFFLLSILLSSCGGRIEPEYKVFRYNQINHITSLDPAFTRSQNNIWAVHHIYNRLVGLDSNLNIIPELAHSWTVDTTGRLYTFHLRSDVPFHEDECFGDNATRNVTAHDVVYSFKRLISPEVASPGSWLFSDKIAGPQAFRAVNDSTFQMSLLTPFLPMLGITAMEYCAILPEEAVTFYGDQFRMNPVGTGPFKFKRWEENQALYLIKNERYFRGAPALDGVKTLFIPDRKIAFLELLNGQLDYVPGLESSFINELLTRDGRLREEKESILNFVKAPYLNMEYLGINLEATKEDSPLRVKAFRQALNYAVDKELMLTSLRNNVGKPAQAGFVPYGLPSYDESKVVGYTYDLEKARELMEEAGFPGGEGAQPLTLFTNKDYLDITTFVAKQWERIGVETEIDVLESSILRDGMRKSSIPLFRASWIADYPDAESFLCMFYSENPPPPNYTRFSDPRFDELYEQVIQEPDLEERIKLYQEMDRILVEQAPVIFLFYDQSAGFYSERMQHYRTNGINLLEVEQLDLKM